MDIVLVMYIVGTFLGTALGFVIGISYAAHVFTKEF